MKSPADQPKQALEAIERCSPADSPKLEQLLPCLRREMPDILGESPVMIAYLYGSVADGFALPFSDVDIALVFEPDCGLSAYERMLLEFDVAAEIERRCDIREADVRSIDTAPLTVQGQVLTQGVLLYSRDEDIRVEFEVNTRKRYFDFQPIETAMREAFFERILQEGLAGGSIR